MRLIQRAQQALHSLWVDRADTAQQDLALAVEQHECRRVLHAVQPRQGLGGCILHVHSDHVQLGSKPFFEPVHDRLGSDAGQSVGTLEFQQSRGSAADSGRGVSTGGGGRSLRRKKEKGQRAAQRQRADGRQTLDAEAAGDGP
jgi:hypothetical protein